MCSQIVDASQPRALHIMPDEAAAAAAVAADSSSSAAFTPSLSALQGAWRHSWGIGLMVRGSHVRFEGSEHSLVLKPVTPDGVHGLMRADPDSAVWSFELEGWTIDVKRSTARQLMWVHRESGEAVWVAGEDTAVGDGPWFLAQQVQPIDPSTPPLPASPRHTRTHLVGLGSALFVWTRAEA